MKIPNLKGLMALRRRPVVDVGDVAKVLEAASEIVKHRDDTKHLERTVEMLSDNFDGVDDRILDAGDEIEITNKEVFRLERRVGRLEKACQEQLEAYARREAILSEMDEDHA